MAEVPPLVKCWVALSMATLVFEGAARPSHSFLHSRKHVHRHGVRHHLAGRRAKGHHDDAEATHEGGDASHSGDDAQQTTAGDDWSEFHSAHPTVGRELDSMSADLHDLASQRSAANAAGEKFDELSQDATDHMAEAFALRHSITIMKAQVAGYDHQLERLQSEEGHLANSSAALDRKLHLIMDPKVAAARGRYQHQQMREVDLAKQVNNLSLSFVNFNASAVAALNQTAEAFTELNEADAELEEAKKKQAEAANNYVALKNKSEQAVLKFKVVDVHYRAEKERLNRTHAFVLKHERALKKMESILTMEEGRVKLALADGQQKLKNRLNKTERAQLHIRGKLEEAEEKYASWQEAERKRAEEAAAKKQEFQESLKAYNTKRQEILHAATVKAVETAQNRSEYPADDDWAWDNDGDVDLSAPLAAADQAANSSETVAEPAEPAGLESNQDAVEEAPKLAAAPEQTEENAVPVTVLPAAQEPRGDVPDSVPHYDVDYVRDDNPVQGSQAVQPKLRKPSKDHGYDNWYDTDYIFDENGEHSSAQGMHKEAVAVKAHDNDAVPHQQPVPAQTPEQPQAPEQPQTAEQPQTVPDQDDGDSFDANYVQDENGDTGSS